MDDIPRPTISSTIQKTQDKLAELQLNDVLNGSAGEVSDAVAAVQEELQLLESLADELGGNALLPEDFQERLKRSKSTTLQNSHASQESLSQPATSQNQENPPLSPKMTSASSQSVPSPKKVYSTPKSSQEDPRSQNPTALSQQPRFQAALSQSLSKEHNVVSSQIPASAAEENITNELEVDDDEEPAVESTNTMEVVNVTSSRQLDESHDLVDQDDVDVSGSFDIGGTSQIASKDVISGLTPIKPSSRGVNSQQIFSDEESNFAETFNAVAERLHAENARHAIVEEQLAQKEQRIRDFQEQITNLKAELEAIKSESQAVRAKYDATRDSLSQLQVEHTALVEKHAAQEKHFLEVESSLKAKVSWHEATVKDKDRHAEQLLSQKRKDDERIAALERENQELKAKVKSVKADFQQQLEESKKREAAAIAELAVKEKSYMQLQIQQTEQLQRSADAIRSKDEETKMAKDELVRIREELVKANARADLLEAQNNKILASIGSKGTPSQDETPSRISLSSVDQLAPRKLDFNPSPAKSQASGSSPKNLTASQTEAPVHSESEVTRGRPKRNAKSTAESEPVESSMIEDAAKLIAMNAAEDISPQKTDPMEIEDAKQPSKKRKRGEDIENTEEQEKGKEEKEGSTNPRKRGRRAKEVTETAPPTIGRTTRSRASQQELPPLPNGSPSKSQVLDLVSSDHSEGGAEMSPETTKKREKRSTAKETEKINEKDINEEIESDKVGKEKGKDKEKERDSEEIDREKEEEKEKDSRKRNLSRALPEPDKSNGLVTAPPDDRVASASTSSSSKKRKAEEITSSTETNGGTVIKRPRSSSRHGSEVYTPPRQVVLAYSGFSKDKDKIKILTMAEALGARVESGSDPCPEMTHLIVSKFPGKESGGKTLKVIIASLVGAYVLPLEYLTASSEEGKWLDPSLYGSRVSNNVMENARVALTPDFKAMPTTPQKISNLVKVVMVSRNAEIIEDLSSASIILGLDQELANLRTKYPMARVMTWEDLINSILEGRFTVGTGSRKCEVTESPAPTSKATKKTSLSLSKKSESSNTDTHAKTNAKEGDEAEKTLPRDQRKRRLNLGKNA